MYYHGSSTSGIKVFEPRPSRVIDGETAVFATNEKWIALVSAVRHTGVDLDYGYVGEAYIAEMWPGAFQMLKQSGYLYYINRYGFHSDPRLGMRNHEFIRRSRVKVVRCQPIPNIYQALKETSIKMIPWSKVARWWRIKKIPVDRSLVNRMYRKKYGTIWPEPHE